MPLTIFDLDTPRNAIDKCRKLEADASALVRESMRFATTSLSSNSAFERSMSFTTASF